MNKINGGDFLSRIRVYIIYPLSSIGNPIIVTDGISICENIVSSILIEYELWLFYNVKLFFGAMFSECHTQSILRRNSRCLREWWNILNTTIYLVDIPILIYMGNNISSNDGEIVMKLLQPHMTFF